ncbi:DUF4185 domain-containing protein [Corynebacterium sp. YSMAA1_1_F7]|uniref:DUF4185 domain-containing protein n=1 Tax=Corynebacterium sp. YSMAA1_1_F7 TaxID=3383590 RepID=UPI0038CFBAB2
MKNTFSARRSLAATLSTGTILATASVVTALSTGHAAADPCWTYTPTMSDGLAASSTGSLAGSLGQPQWLTGKPEGMPKVTGNTEALHMLTGRFGPDRTDKTGLSSTDLGIMWDSGDGRVLAAFGDSFRCGAGNNGWHSNALYETDDMDPSNGIYLTGPATGSRSEEFLPASLKIDGVEKTIIPTAGIEVNGAQYVDFMSVRDWGRPGQWRTNYAATAKSTDGGKTFSVIRDSYRSSSVASGDSRLPDFPAHSPGADNFQMTAFAKPPQDTAAEDGYVYVYGTPSGRSGQARLARISEAEFPNFSSAEFWDGQGWTTRMDAAKTVLDGRVSELSVQYNKHLGKWLALYETTQGMVLRQADRPEGPWSSEKTLISRAQVPDIYGGFMYPHQTDGNLYWVATSWNSYNAVVYKTDLAKVF